MTKSKVFHETYESYLQELSRINIYERAVIVGAVNTSSGVTVQFFGNDYLISSDSIECVNGNNVSFAVKVVLCKYLLMAPSEKVGPDSPWVTFRDFKDSTPLHSYFANNTNKTIETSFSGRLKAMQNRCLEVGGEVIISEGYDLSVRFSVLPKISLVLNFNDADDLFPAVCSILFQKSAEKYLDMECLAITGTYLAGKLVSAET